MNQLYDDLAAVRSRLKFKNMDGGRIPTVCTDEALRDLAIKAPRYKHELEYISGLGKVFVEKYGDAFMEVLDAYHKKEINSKTLTHDVRMTLKNLENRLININKRNRLLYQPKLSDKTGIDLYSPQATQNKRILDCILGEAGRSVKLCDVSDGKEESRKLYARYVTLHREAVRTFRESGQQELYIGYPYVIGKIFGKDGFEVRAPLALFPAELIRQPDNFSFRIDGTRDILFNNNLILCQYKFGGITRPLPNNAAQKESRKAFGEEIAAFYADAGVKLGEEVPFAEAQKFIDYTAAEFPPVEGGVFAVQNHAVLGRFSLYSSAMQKDFAQILEQDEINENLYELLDKEADGATPPDEEITEEKLFYITDLNSSQERAMLAINAQSLVIQGPPGTGKSQAIVSIIADQVNKGKNVLMVSQKKAAIDVIYSRLGHLSKYALFIDDAKNKEAFYAQVYRLLYAQEPEAETEADFASVSKQIQRRVEDLEEINKRLFTSQEGGDVAGLIYAENVDNPFLNGDYSGAAALQKLLPEGLGALPYADTKAIFDSFKSEKLRADSGEYFTLVEAYPFLSDVKRQLGEFERYNLKAAAAEFLQKKEEHKALGFFKKIGNRPKLKKFLRGVLREYFLSKKHLRYIFKRPQAFIEGTNKLENYLRVARVYDALTPPAREYGAALWQLAKKEEGAAANQKIYDYLVFRLTHTFEKQNPEILSAARAYNDTIARLSDKLDKKRRLSRLWLTEGLHGFYRDYLLTAKRLGEMRRSVESKRKPAIPRFIERFGFELFKGVKIWIMTTETVSEVLPCKEMFDLVIFDEASQIYIEKTVPSFARAKRSVISGDHKQLRPSSLGVGRLEYDDEEEEESVVGDSNAALEEESLLDLVRFKFNEVMLNYHYRSRYNELINFSNHVFYNGRIFVAPNTEIPEKPPIEVIKVNGLWVNRQNRAEAERVVKLVKEIFAARKKGETVGIVTFNSNQRDLVTDLLDAEAVRDPDFGTAYQREQDRKENGEDIGIFVKNIENVQGDERDIMIFSVAYAKSQETGKVVRNYGWLNQTGGENRLNVAVTRAKQKIYIVTSITAEELVVEDLMNEGPKIFKKYLEYAYAVSGGNADKVDVVLQSINDTRVGGGKGPSRVKELLLTELSARGIAYKTDIGVGGYKLDIAIEDDSGRFVLGIEIDTSLYGKGTARERDLHRSRYMAAKGWKIHRVFSPKFDLKREMETILGKIGGTESV